MTETERQLVATLEAVRGDMERIPEALDGMTADLREINRDLAVFAARRTQARIDDPVA